jgi:hypothetical protein
VLVDGDVVGGGPENRACWELVHSRVQSHDWLVLRGNHEDYVVEWADPAAPKSGILFEMNRLSYWAYQQLDGDVAALAALPDRWSWRAPDGSLLLAMHGTLQGNRAGIYPWTPDEEAQARIIPGARLFVTAHTHIPHQRQLNGTEIINVGAVGLPGDGDSRASYGRFTWQPGNGWQAEITRVVYDRRTTERVFYTSGFLEQVGAAAWMTLVELRSATDAKTRWAALYRQRVLDGEMTIDHSVFEFLDTAEWAAYLSKAEYEAIQSLAAP